MRPASVGFQCPVCVKEASATVREAQAPYGGKAQQRPLVTQVLIGINVAVFVLTTLTGTGLLAGGNPSELFRRLAMVPLTEINGLRIGGAVGDGVANGGYYRLLTSMFLHYGIIHIALNMLCLYQLGPYVERTLGRLRFIGLYLLSGIGGSALSYSGIAGGSPFVQAAGASGAVFGLFAAFYLLERKRGGDVTSIAVIIGFNLFLSFQLRFIDWRGHVGGLITGALLTSVLIYAPRGNRRALLQVAGFLAVVVLIIGMVAVRTSALVLS